MWFLNLPGLLVLLRLRRKEVEAHWLALAYGGLLATEYILRHSTVDAILGVSLLATLLAYLYFLGLNRLQRTPYFWVLLVAGVAFLVGI